MDTEVGCVLEANESMAFRMKLDAGIPVVVNVIPRTLKNVK